MIKTVKGIREHSYVKKIIILAVLAIFIPIFSLVALSVGVININIFEAFSLLIKKAFEHNPNSIMDEVKLAVVWDIRLPRVLMAIISGAGLAMAGITLQGALRNPLVSPFTLGISSAASFGAALAIVLGIGLTGFGPYMIISNAFIFSLIAVGLSLGIAKIKGMTQESLILAGISMMYLFSAMVTLLQYIAQEWELKALVYWIMGDLSFANWNRLSFTLPAVIIFIPIFRYAWDLNVLAMGEDVAKSLGTDPRITRLICVILASLTTATIVCMTGPIGFIGLVSPHISRLLLGSDHRVSMIGSALLGALILLVSDTLARSIIAPVELPVGVITAFLGVPLFVHLLLKARREIWQ